MGAVLPSVAWSKLTSLVEGARLASRSSVDEPHRAAAGDQDTLAPWTTR
jgi:hypothetical protein